MNSWKFSIVGLLLMQVFALHASCLENGQNFLAGERESAYYVGDRNYLPWDPRKREQEIEQDSPFEPLYDEVPPPDWEPPRPDKDGDNHKIEIDYGDDEDDANVFHF